MSNPIIRVENLGKKYVIGHRAEAGTLRDRLAGIFHPRSAGRRTSSEEFWALRDLSFEVNRGEVVGIIGRNGAGKSTLLKILSRITEPTTGRITLEGRVASLLEVGTGFHPELTGRENIFLNGAILGMSRAEIRKKFDEIVAFAEIERFLDTPVKRYSSGMYVRLAFAVAAHLDPEILIVDEVLAVGDAEFQKKCLGKMQNVAQGEGRTVLFVSHQMAAVQNLCRRCIHLREGRLAEDGPAGQVIETYLRPLEQGTPPALNYTHRCDWLEIESIDILLDDRTVSTVPSGSTATFRLAYRCSDPARAPRGIECSFIVWGNGQKLVNFWSEAGTGGSFPIQDRGVISCTVPAWPFRAQSMSLTVGISRQRELLVEAHEAVVFSGIDTDRFGTGILPHSSEGMLLLAHEWRSDPGPK